MKQITPKELRRIITEASGGDFTGIGDSYIDVCIDWQTLADAINAWFAGSMVERFRNEKDQNK